MISLTKRVIRQMKGDRRSLALVLFAPLLVLSLMYLLLGGSDYKPTIAFDEANLPSILVNAIKEQDTQWVDASPVDIKQYLKDNKNVDAFLATDRGKMSIIMLEASSKASEAMEVIQKAASSINPTTGLEAEFVYGSKDSTLFSSMGYIFLGILSFFFVFIISGMALVRERSSGTLERLLMTPVKRIDVILGYTCGYGFFAIIQAILIVLYSVFVLGISCEGNILWVILIMLMLAIAAVSFGAMISVFSNSEFQVVQFIPIVLVPQIFFSGIIPLDMIPYGLGNLCYITPIYYGCAAIKVVMIEGGGFSQVWHFILALALYTVVLCGLNTVALRKYRRL